jgi:hypothetical protein
MKTKLSNITIVLVITSILFLTGCSRSRASEDKPAAGDELATLKREYADVLALQGTSKGEILAIARILRANPEMALDRTAASGEYCFKSGPGTNGSLRCRAGTDVRGRCLRTRRVRSDRSRPGPGAHETAT